MKNEVTVKIFNREFRLLTDETKEYTDRLASELNRKMAELIKAKPTLSLQDAAALICLECCDELTKARQSIENIRSQIKDYVDDAGEARTAADEAQKELRTLRERVAQLEKEVKLRKSFAEEGEKLSAKDMISHDINKALENKYPYNYGKKQ
ncbi:cell division protein ZapA [Ruminococcus sp. Marseille-P6503]|uniref:cell division protein ZapA n=1 Tax=Ruminococcus sp. Marseille-P6503 TaxID=2364796 RepID=UPI000F528D90|nr:cell division protein ZapA [Ruminococcus sp. Marseille-P6503]